MGLQGGVCILLLRTKPAYLMNINWLYQTRTQCSTTPSPKTADIS
jgi:hypothetical protein